MSCGNYWYKQIGVAACTGVDDMESAIDRVLVAKVHGRLRLWILVDIAALHDQAKAFTGVEAGARGPDLDFESDHVAGFDLLLVSVYQKRLVLG